MAIESTQKQITVDEYYHLAELGILNQDDRVELIDGEIIPMSPIGSTHASVLAGLNIMLVRLLADRYFVAKSNPALTEKRTAAGLYCGSLS
jgi:Uma2 family endonuclease